MTRASRSLARALELPPAETASVRVERDIAIPMADGVELLADRYVPSSGAAAPLVLVRSPYGRRGHFGLLYGRLLAERGFQVLIQSCRGTFGSGGHFDPYSEQDDGLATVAWMRRQPWYPGAFATAGPSYLGLVQWAIAGAVGPELRAIAVQIATSDPRATIYQGGAFSLETSLAWADLLVHQGGRLAFVRRRLGRRRLPPLLNHLPLRDLDQLAVGRPVRYWQEWLAHNEPGDPYWNRRSFSDSLPGVTAPVSLVGGWHDVFLPAVLRDYVALVKGGQTPYLMIGPWSHSDHGGMAASVRDTLASLRAHLLDDRSQLRPAPVRIFIAGAGEWRDLPAWPPPAEPQRWHLHPAGKLDPSPAVASEPDRYSYDPADPTPSVGGPSERPGEPQVDNRELESRPDVLTYTSTPLGRDLDLIGEVAADLFVRSSAGHTDFFARLCDVDPSGRSINVCDALVRLTPGGAVPDSDGVVRVRIELWPTAYRFRAGHQLRLQVSSGAHPRYARNPGTGEPLATATMLAVAHQCIYHEPGYPSAVILPVSQSGASS
jgi:putative CocE/NonD family hydrolase